MLPMTNSDDPASLVVPYRTKGDLLKIKKKAMLSNRLAQRHNDSPRLHKQPLLKNHNKRCCSGFGDCCGFLTPSSCKILWLFMIVFLLYLVFLVILVLMSENTNGNEHIIEETGGSSRSNSWWPFSLFGSKRKRNMYDNYPPINVFDENTKQFVNRIPTKRSVERGMADPFPFHVRPMKIPNLDDRLQASEEAVNKLVPALLRFTDTFLNGTSDRVSLARNSQELLENGQWSNLDSYRLRHYSNMQEALDAYIQFHAHQTKLYANGNEMTASVLMVTPVEGWGNMVRSITSSLYLAMITGRVLYLNMPYVTLERYFRSKYSSWNVPRESLVESCYIYRLHHCPECEQNREHLKSKPIDSILKYPCMHIVTYSPLHEMLAVNPSTKSTFQRFNTDPDWNLVYRYFSFDQPSQLVEDKLSEITKVFKSVSTVYGVQIRSGIVDTDDHRLSSRFISLPTSGRMALCLRRILEASSAASLSAVSFLTTDNPTIVTLFARLIEPLEQKLNKKLLYYLPPSQIGHSNYNATSMDDAVANWVALSRAHYIMGSFGSSFVETARQVHGAKTYWIAQRNLPIHIDQTPFHTSIPPICADAFPYIPSH